MARNEIDYEMHEDFVMWHHWHDVSLIVDQDIARLEKITDQGLYTVDVDSEYHLCCWNTAQIHPS